MAEEARRTLALISAALAATVLTAGCLDFVLPRTFFVTETLEYEVTFIGANGQVELLLPALYTRTDQQGSTFIGTPAVMNDLRSVQGAVQFSIVNDTTDFRLISAQTTLGFRLAGSFRNASQDIRDTEMYLHYRISTYQESANRSGEGTLRVYLNSTVMEPLSLRVRITYEGQSDLCHRWMAFNGTVVFDPEIGGAWQELAGTSSGVCA